jgi:hypothetical protein
VTLGSKAGVAYNKIETAPGAVDKTRVAGKLSTGFSLPVVVAYARDADDGR